jgi:hypothetical protein
MLSTSSLPTENSVEEHITNHEADKTEAVSPIIGNNEVHSKEEIKQ